MTKAELVAKIAEQAELKTAQAEKAFNAIIESVKTELEEGRSIALSGLGTFSVTTRAARTGRNPRTGEEIDIPACKAIKFKAGKTLKDSVN
ncbi:MAG: HU family DNA-binding protein [Deltaproteobacteria bacterium]|nr:HU family DNA-binding protein [Deltaproteobacteria bacterium]